MNAADLLRDCQIRSRDFESRAFQPIDWMRLLNDANDYAATIARSGDSTYLLRTFTVAGTIPTTLPFLPDDIAAILDVRFVKGTGAFVHARPVRPVEDVSDARSDQPRYRIVGRQLSLKGGWVNAGDVTRTEIEYQRSAQPLFRARFAVGGAGPTSTTPTIEKIPDTASTLNENVVVRTDALAGVSVEVTSGTGIGQRRNVISQAGAVLTLDSGFTGTANGDTLAVVPPWPEDTHSFIAVKALYSAFSAENNPRGAQAVKPELDQAEDRFRRAIDKRVDGLRFEILDTRGDETFW